MLVVDSHVTTRLAVQHLLTTWGAQHASAADGPAALRALCAGAAAAPPL